MHHGQHQKVDRLIQIPLGQSRIAPVAGGTPSIGSDVSSDLVQSRLPSLNPGTAWVETGNRNLTRVASLTSHSEREILFDRLVALKVHASQVAMHFADDWRSGLFSQLDCLLDEENWHFEDKLPQQESFRTLLRTVIYNEIRRRPGLGLSPAGNLIAAWTVERDRLTVECMVRDQLRYTLIKYVDEERVSAAGQAPAQYLRKYIAPYEPEVRFG